MCPPLLVPVCLVLIGLVLLIVDHQLGLLQLVKDYTTAEFRNNVLAHAEFGKLFNLPVIMTTSAETGILNPSVPMSIDGAMLIVDHRTEWASPEGDPRDVP